MEEQHIEPSAFFRTMRARELMLLHGRPASALALARYLKRDPKDMREDLEALERAGLVTSQVRGFELTEEGQASLRWSSPPPPDGVIRTRWVGELARAIAEHYGVTMRELLSNEVGAGVVARSRLCFALWARGWAFERVEEHFGLPPGWARRAVERWKRMRDEMPPRTGAELKAWRARHGLTQKQAAERLGVNRRTVMRAERSDTFTPRMAFGRA